MEENAPKRKNLRGRYNKLIPAPNHPHFEKPQLAQVMQPSTMRMS